jgi:hypothetical protein
VSKRFTADGQLAGSKPSQTKAATPSSGKSREVRAETILATLLSLCDRQTAAGGRETSNIHLAYTSAKVANRNVRDFEWEIAHAAVSRHLQISLSRIL